MHLKLPEVNKCCFCCSLRWGIILFGYINIVFSLFAVSCLVIITELNKEKITGDSSLEVITSTALFAILGMSVILNILLLVAGYQKDAAMLRLYNFYATATTITALVPTIILLSRFDFLEVCIALFAIVTQCYVIVLVRSEAVKLEKKKNIRPEGSPSSIDPNIEIPETDTLV